MKKPSLITKIAIGAVTLGVGFSTLPGASAADEYVADGLTSETAAASCWEIKQNNPESASGAYWLWTPQMPAPEQFYCDQETDGGGWVMIGRGREGWSEDYAGKGDPKQLAQNPDGTDAFTPVQLPSTTVDSLLNGQKVSDLSDGIRFRRAGNEDGTLWQNMYAQRTQTNNWSWTLSAYQPWANLNYDNDPELAPDRTVATSINRVSNDNDYYYSNNFYGRSNQSWKIGFAYGRYIFGSDSSTSYLWSPFGVGNAIPFTQVYMRPKVTQADLQLTDYADTGTGEVTKRALPVSFSSKVTWRTSEASGTGSNSELHTRVQAINQLGDTVFIGGDFANLNNAVSGETVEQKFIAGFDVNTGELVRTFMPTLNGQVKAIEPLPNGMLAVGGEFTQVNGQPSNGLVILDPVTGATDTSLGWDVVNRGASGVSFVKSITVHGNYVYIGGNFTHVKGATSEVYAYSKNIARFRLHNNSVDWTWRPTTNGTVNGISASDDGVALAGYFTTVGTSRAWKLAYLNTTNGALAQQWEWKLSHRANNPYPSDGFQFDVQDAGSTIWTGGAEHLVAQYDKSNLNNRLNSAITKSGGDFQDLSLNNGVIYAACHCGDWIYSGADTHDSPWRASTYHGVNTIRLIGALDAATGEVIPEFNPRLQGAKGHGVWSSFTDSNGTLWVGGDITRSLGYNGVQRTVGFARFVAGDSVAPASASNLSVTTTGGFDNLTWDGSSERGVTYQILRNNRVVGSTTSTTYKLPTTPGARYFVRVADSAGNLSASTPVAIAAAGEVPGPVVPPAVQDPETPVAPDEEEEPAPEEPAPANPSVKPIEQITEDPEPPIVDENQDPIDPIDPVDAEEPADQQVLASGDKWDVAFFLNNQFDRTWRDTDYAYNTARQWYTAPTSIGWGEFSVATRVQYSLFNQPMSFLARKELQITPKDNQELVITTYADDGIAVYVNGKEVSRQNLPADASPSTPALAPVAYSIARATPITIVVPASELNQGKNVIAVEVHSARRYQSATFDMEATLRNVK